MTVGGLAATTLAQQDDGLILASGQEISVGCLGHAVNMRGGVLPPAALKHLHHLERRKKKVGEWGARSRGEMRIFILILIFCYCRIGASLYAAAYLLGVHGGGVNGVNNHHIGARVGVHQVTAVPLPHGVHHARLIQILQRGQVLHSVKHWRVCLESKVTSSQAFTQSHL